MNLILFETAAGYSLFERIGEDEIQERNVEVQQQYQDFEFFSKVIKLRSWYIFESLQVALENMNDLSEGVLNVTLSNFLENNLPKSSKVVLGVVDEKIGLSIKENLGLKVERSPVVTELVRSIRLHFPTFIKRLSDSESQADYTAAQKGLAHAYSRSKVKFNVNKADIMVIHGIALLNQLNKDVNIFSMRLREWYSRHFPELSRIVPENNLYARCVNLIGSQSNLNEGMTAGLKEILNDDDRVQEIFNAAKSSMGFDLSEIDMACINNFAKRVVSISKHRECIEKYLVNRMNEVAPNLSALIGESLGATLISRAGSLTNLSKYPASTIQVLGAEKALFRAIKSRGNTPKYGSIYNSTFIAKAKAKDKGRISRYLANKCSLATRLDAFGDIETSMYGLAMRQQVEDRLHFYETGENPARNVDVMHAITEKLNSVDTAENLNNKPSSQNKKRQRDDSKSDMDKISAVQKLANHDEESVVTEVQEKSQSQKKEKHKSSTSASKKDKKSASKVKKADSVKKPIEEQPIINEEPIVAINTKRPKINSSITSKMAGLKKLGKAKHKNSKE